MDKMVGAWRRPSAEGRLCLPWISCQFAATLSHRLMPDAAAAACATHSADQADATHAAYHTDHADAGADAGAGADAAMPEGAVAATSLLPTLKSEILKLMPEILSVTESL